ncbi:DUF5610 domain-containing protein [Galenea microaerophila]
MAITPTSISKQVLSAYQIQQSAASQKTNHAELKEVTVRNEKQAVFVSHFFENSQDQKEGALKITYQLAIEKLNERLEADSGQKNTLSEEKLKKQGGIDYWSPENVAQRIVQGATGFLDDYQKNHPELSGEKRINSFLELVGNGVKKGFSEAQSILKELKVFDGEIADNYHKTFDLVQKGFEAFRRQQLGLPPLENQETTADEKSVDVETADK